MDRRENKDAEMAVTRTAFTIACAVLNITGTKCLHKELKNPARHLVQDTSPPSGYEPQALQWPNSLSSKAALLLACHTPLGEATDQEEFHKGQL